MDWNYGCQQKVCTIAGFRVGIKFRFHYIHLSRGAGRNWSALTFRFAPLLSPPMPATAQTQTVIFNSTGTTMNKLWTLVIAIGLWTNDSLGQGTVCDSIYTIVDTMPTYGKGYQDIAKYLLTTLKFSKKDCRPEDLKRLTWTINKEGKMTDIDVVGVGEQCRTRIIEQLKDFPQWTPGSLNGEPVCVKMVFPFHIRPSY